VGRLLIDKDLLCGVKMKALTLVQFFGIGYKSASDMATPMKATDAESLIRFAEERKNQQPLHKLRGVWGNRLVFPSPKYLRWLMLLPNGTLGMAPLDINRKTTSKLLISWFIMTMLSVIGERAGGAKGRLLPLYLQPSLVP